MMLLAVATFTALFFLPSWVLMLTVQDPSQVSSAHRGVPISDAVRMYVPLGFDAPPPLAVDNSMMDHQADPCNDPVGFWCGTWIHESGVYRRKQPTSYSVLQRNAVGIVSQIIADEKSSAMSLFLPLAQFHQSCVHTRSAPATWGQQSKLFMDLVQDIRQRPWNGDTMASFFGRMMAIGADLPFSIVPIADPSDTTNGRWIAKIMQAGMIGCGDFSSPLSTPFHVRHAMANMFPRHLEIFNWLWKYTDEGGEKLLTRESDALHVMMALSEIFTGSRDSCWQRMRAEASSYAAYFQDTSCFHDDCIGHTEFDTLVGRTQFNWRLFMAQINSAAWAKIDRVWTPEGRSWFNTVLDPMLFSPEIWRNYLETSVRYAALQHYASAWRDHEWRAGIVSPIISDVVDGGNWATPGRSNGGGHVLASRRKQWVPGLRTDGTHMARMARFGDNGVEYLSEELCTDLTFVHLQPLIEQRFINTMDVAHDQLRALVQQGVATLRKLIAHSAAWTESTRQLFDRKMQELVIEIGSTNRTAPALHILSASPDSLVQNMFLVRQDRVRSSWTLTGPAARGGQAAADMPMYELPVFYDAASNRLMLLATLFQWPLWSYEAEPEIIYSRVLSLVAQQLSHAFDANGRYADWSGSALATGYWKQSVKVLDRIAFEETDQCLMELYDTAISRHGTREDGQLVLAECLSDVVGLRVAYNSLAPESQASKQLFFGGWAQAWCERLTGAEERKLIDNNVHDFHEMRITLPFANMPEYAAAFQCPHASRMSMEGHKRCQFFH